MTFHKGVQQTKKDRLPFLIGSFILSFTKQIAFEKNSWKKKSLKLEQRSVGDKTPEVLFANQLEKMNGLEREPFTVFSSD